MKHQRIARTAGLVLIPLLLCSMLLLSACVAGAGELLAYQSASLHLRVAYFIGSTPLEAELQLAAGGADRDMTLILLAPPEVAGITYTRVGGHVTASHGETALSMPAPDAVLLPLSMFAIPTDVPVGEVTRLQDGARRITLATSDTTWTLTLPHGVTVPTEITRTAENAHFSLTVREVLP